MKTHDPVSLKSMIVRSQAGDQQAMDELIRTSHGWVRRIAVGVLPKASVEDAVQETFLIVLTKIRHLKHPQAYRSWLCRIALHVCYGLSDKVRPADELPADLRAPQADLEAALDLRRALDALGTKDRAIVVLRDYLSLSYSEIAEVLAIPEGTVRSRLFNARKRLKGILSPEPPRLAAVSLVCFLALLTR